MVREMVGITRRSPKTASQIRGWVNVMDVNLLASCDAFNVVRKARPVTLMRRSTDERIIASETQEVTPSASFQSK